MNLSGKETTVLLRANEMSSTLVRFQQQIIYIANHMFRTVDGIYTYLNVKTEMCVQTQHCLCVCLYIGAKAIVCSNHTVVTQSKFVIQFHESHVVNVSRKQHHNIDRFVTFSIPITITNINITLTLVHTFLFASIRAFYPKCLALFDLQPF